MVGTPGRPPGALIGRRLTYWAWEYARPLSRLATYWGVLTGPLTQVPAAAHRQCVCGTWAAPMWSACGCFCRQAAPVIPTSLYPQLQLFQWGGIDPRRHTKPYMAVQKYPWP